MNFVFRCGICISVRVLGCGDFAGWVGGDGSF